MSESGISGSTTSRPDVSLVGEARRCADLERSRAPRNWAPQPSRTRAERTGANFKREARHPILVGEALPADALAELAGGAPPASGSALIAAWDLAAEPATTRIVDRSPNALHGTTVNAPSRGVTGPYWRGEPALTYAEGSGDYNAIHLHADDIDDAGWPPGASVTVAADAAPGIYAAHVEV